MATKDQYEVFKSAYDEEAARYTELNDRIKTYLSVITLYSGLLIVKAADLTKSATSSVVAHEPTILFELGSLAFVLALIIFLLSGRVRKYTAALDPVAFIEGLDDDHVLEDATFYDTLIGNLADSTGRNSAQNNAVAKGIFIGSIFLIVGICLNLLYVTRLLL